MKLKYKVLIFMMFFIGIGIYGKLTEKPFTQVTPKQFTSEPITSYDRERARRNEYWKDKVYPTTPYNWGGAIKYQTNSKFQNGNTTDAFQNIDLTDPYLLDRVEDEIGK